MKMDQTGITHAPRDSAEVRAAAEARFVYDAGQIDRWIRHTRHAETGTEALFARGGAAPLRLSYEAITQAGADATLARIARAHLGVALPPAALSRTAASGDVRIATARNADFAARFRAEAPGRIAELDAARAGMLAR